MIDTNECMLWAGVVNTQGYGKWTRLIDGKRVSAHRAMYMILVGEIPKGLTIDHLCNTPACINVDHMEVVTRRENTLRSSNPAALNKKKTVCKNGHPLIGENLYVYKNMRNCLTCRRKIASNWDKQHRHWSNGVRYTI